jgi:uncharacterized protein YdaT
MPWNKKTFPDSMRNLPAPVRNKAIDIGNALLKETGMDEGIAIATAISRAKDWAKNRDKPTTTRNTNTKSTDVKIHGEDRYVIPEEEGWAVKKEKGRKHHFSTKQEAVKEARKGAKEANAAVTIQDRHGKIASRTSYNPNRRQAKQK